MRPAALQQLPQLQMSLRSLSQPRLQLHQEHQMPLAQLPAQHLPPLQQQLHKLLLQLPSSNKPHLQLVHQQQQVHLLVKL